MKNKIKFVSIILFLSVFMMIVSYGQQKAEWKGKIEYEDGVKVIKNPKEPLYGEIKFELEEDLGIGREDDDNYMLYKVRDIQVDEDGNIYVLELGNFRIQKFDPHRNYLLTIGRQGQGPGEFELPIRIQLNNKSRSLYVEDGTRIKIFDWDGNFLNNITLKNRPRDFLVDVNGNVWGKLAISTESGRIYAFGKVNDQGEIEKEISRFPYEWSMSKSGESVVVITTGDEHDVFIADIAGQNFIYGYSKEYELYVTDNEGSLLYKINKDEPYRDFSAKEKRKARGGRFPIKLPPHKAFFYSIFIDSEGRIYTQRNKGRRYGTEAKELDIFSKDGYYLYKTTLPHAPFVIKNGYLYTHIVNEDTGEELVKRFKIKNWDRIKKGI